MNDLVSDMDDLVKWLRGVFNDEEQAANRATSGPWIVTHEGEIWTGWAASRWKDAKPEPYPIMLRGGGAQLTDAEHVARHDPARVLAEVDAKRGLLLHISNELADDPAAWQRGSVPGEMLRLLALPYADQPGWREEWRP